MPVRSDSDSDVGHVVPGLDGDNERRLRYQEKLRDAQDLRNRRQPNAQGQSDIFEFSNRQKDRKIAVDLSSDDDFEECKSEIISNKQRNRRKRPNNEGTDSSDSDVVEISSFRRTGRGQIRNPTVHPLLENIDYSQLCSEKNIRQMQSQNPVLRQSLAIVEESSKLIGEIRTPIELDQYVASPKKTPTEQALPSLVSLEKVFGFDKKSDTRLKTSFRLFDPDSQFFINFSMFIDDNFSELYKKASQFFDKKIWLTIKDYEIDMTGTPAQLCLQDGDIIKISTIKPSKGLYEPKQATYAPGSFELKFCISGKQEVLLNVTGEDTFAQIRQRLCSANGFEKVVFLMDGQRVDELEKVSDLDLEDGDQIDIKVS